MLDFNVIWDIRKKAISSIKSDSDGNIIDARMSKGLYFLLYWLLPCGLLLYGLIGPSKLSSFATFIGTGIAIYTGLFFSLLLNIGTKVRAESNNPNKENKNFQRYKTGMKQIAHIALYVILLGVTVFVLVLLNALTLQFNIPYSENVLTGIALFFLTRFFASLFFMIQRFYFLVQDEISNIL